MEKVLELFLFENSFLFELLILQNTLSPLTFDFNHVTELLRKFFLVFIHLSDTQLKSKLSFSFLLKFLHFTDFFFEVKSSSSRFLDERGLVERELVSENSGLFVIWVVQVSHKQLMCDIEASLLYGCNAFEPGQVESEELDFSLDGLFTSQQLQDHF